MKNYRRIFMSENINKLNINDLVFEEIENLVNCVLPINFGDYGDRHQLLPIRIIEESIDIDDDLWTEKSTKKILQVAMVNRDDLQVLNKIKGRIENQGFEVQILRITEEEYNQILEKLYQLGRITPAKVKEEEMSELIELLFNISECQRYQFLPIKILKNKKKPIIIIAMINIDDLYPLNFQKLIKNNNDNNYIIKRVSITKDNFDQLLHIAINILVKNPCYHPFYHKLIQSGCINKEHLPQLFKRIKQNYGDVVKSIEQSLEYQLSPELIKQYKILKQYKNYQIFDLKILYGLDCIEIDSTEFNLIKINELIHSNIISYENCRRYQLLPIKLEKNLKVLVVAMVNPDDLAAIDTINQILRYQKLTLRKVVIRKEDYDIVVKKHYEFEQHIKREKAKEERERIKQKAINFSQEDVDKLVSQIRWREFNKGLLENQLNSINTVKSKSNDHPQKKSVNKTNIIEILTLKIKDFFALITRSFQPSQNVDIQDILVKNVFNYDEDNEIKEDANQPPIIALVNKILIKAIKDKATYIHIEFNAEDYSFRVRFRIDGVLQEVFQLPKSIAVMIKNRLILIAYLDQGKDRRGIMQEALVSRIFEGKTIEFLFNIFPADYGDKIIIQIIN